MASVGLGARVLLALVFTIAAAGKLADHQGTLAALEDFRIPRRALTPFAVALPCAELLTAAALLVQPSALWGAVAALVLLAAFAAGIGSAMFRGESPDCHCFGQLHSEPASRRTLIRNALLALPAVFVLADGPGTRLDSWLPSSSAANVVALIAPVAIAGLTALALQLHLQNRRLRRDLKRVRDATANFPAGPPIGTPAPRFSLADVYGNTVTLDALLSIRRPIALVFVSPDCPSCELMLPSLASWQRRLAHRMTIVIAGSGTARELRGLSQPHGLRNVLVDSDSEMFAAYRTSATPSAVTLTADGTVRSAMHSTAPLVEALIRRALADLDGQSAALQNGGGLARDGDRVEVVQATPARA